MKTSVKRLRASMKSILTSVKSGEEVVIYSHKEAIAMIIPYKKRRKLEDVGFGMWSDHPDMQDISTYTRKIRKGRKHDF